MDQDSFVHSMVSDTFEEDPPSEQRDLESMDIDIGAIIVPCIRSYTIGDEGREKAIEVEQEEQGAETAISSWTDRQQLPTYRTPETMSSTRKNL